MNALILISSLFAMQISAIFAAAVGSTVETGIVNSGSACDTALCQDGFRCDPNYVCKAVPCIPRCMPVGVRRECGMNEELNECGNGCEPTCTEEMQACTLQCGPAACKCQEGFVREPMGRCIKKMQCPVAAMGFMRNSRPLSMN
ncbi:unnamed protein product, partial [Mesorhabditis spiculigera]